MSSIIHLSRITRGQSSGKLIVKTQTLLIQLQLSSCPTDKILIDSKKIHLSKEHTQARTLKLPEALSLVACIHSPRELEDRKSWENRRLGAGPET